MKYVIYTCYVDVTDEYRMKNGRLKLLELGDKVSEICMKAVAGTPHAFDLSTEVSEAVIASGTEDENECFERRAQTYAKVVVEREMPNFSHVRKKVLENYPKEYANYMPKAPFEEVVFRFFKLLGLEICRKIKLDWSPVLKIKVQDGNYRELLRLSVNEDFENPKNLREYERLFAEIYGSDILAAYFGRRAEYNEQS